MENLSGLVILLCAVTVARAQEDPKTAAMQDSTSIASARCAYVLDAACLPMSPTDREASAAQRTPGPRMRPRPMPIGPPYGRYPDVWAEPGSGRHALVGAIIGFGLGAAIGAKGTSNAPGANRPAASILIGGIGGLLGAAVGYGTPSFPRRNRYRRGPWPDEENQNAQNRGATGPASVPPPPKSLLPSPPPGRAALGSVPGAL